MPRPIQPYDFQADLIWCDGTFKIHLLFRIRMDPYWFGSPGSGSAQVDTNPDPIANNDRQKIILFAVTWYYGNPEKATFTYYPLHENIHAKYIKIICSLYIVNTMKGFTMSSVLEFQDQRTETCEKIWYWSTGRWCWKIGTSTCVCRWPRPHSSCSWPPPPQP